MMSLEAECAVLYGSHNGAGEMSRKHERGKMLMKIRETMAKWKCSWNISVCEMG